MTNIDRSARVQFRRRNDKYILKLLAGTFTKAGYTMTIDPVLLAGAADGTVEDVEKLLKDVGAGVLRALTPRVVPDQHVIAYLQGFVTAETGVTDGRDEA